MLPFAACHPTCLSLPPFDLTYKFPSLRRVLDSSPQHARPRRCAAQPTAFSSLQSWIEFSLPMALLSSLKPVCRGLVCPRIGAVHPKLLSHIHCQNCMFKSHNGIQVPFQRYQISWLQHFLVKEYTSSAGDNHHHLTFDDDYDQEPFWLNLVNEAYRAVKSLLTFLAEQPSQLKHIEWPSFQSTLKTAILSLILVVMLIIALSAVDSTLFYILSVLSRHA